MSHYYLIHCVTCFGRDKNDPKFYGNGQPLWWNRADVAVLKGVVKALPALAELDKVRHFGSHYYLGVHFDAGGPESTDDLIGYAVKHAGHEVVPVDQYGAFCDECAESFQCGGCGRWEHCVLPEGHDPSIPHSSKRAS